MCKLSEIVVYIFAAIGLACVVKHIHTMYSKKGCCLCDKHKTKEEYNKTPASHKTEEDEKRTGSRYGSNPAKY